MVRGALIDAVRRRVGVAVALGAALLALGACGGGGSSHPSYATLITEGTTLLAHGNSAEASKKFQQAIARKPNGPVAYYDLGVVYQRQRKLFQARREYGLAIHYDPAYVPALYNQAGLFANINPPLAIFYYRRIIRIKPNSPTAYLNLGLVEAGGPGLRKQALRDLTRAVKLDPSLRAQVPAPLRSVLPQPSKG